MEIENKVFNDKIEEGFRATNWKGLIHLLRKEIVKGTNNYWYIINYAIALYYSGRDDEALEYSRKAISLNRKDPFVLYHHGIILFRDKKFKEAITFWTRILKMPDKYLFYGIYGDGKRWGLSLKNDTIYYIALTFLYLNKLEDSIRFYNRHLKNRRRGIPSFVTKKQVEQELFETISLKKETRNIYISVLRRNC